MASQWPSFTKQKVFLATTLIQLADNQAHAAEREAAIQGTIALLVEARDALLQLIADIYQVRHAAPSNLEELVDLLEGERTELEELRALSVQAGSWWQRIEILRQAQRQPMQRKASVEQENLIAVAADSGPDRSTATLRDTALALKRYIEMILERHDEW